VKKINKTLLVLLCAMVVLSSCGSGNPSVPAETLPPYTDADLAADLGITAVFPSLDEDDPSLNGSETKGNQSDEAPETVGDEDGLNNPDSIAAGYSKQTEYRMKVCSQMEIYASMEDKSPQTVLTDGESVVIRELEGNNKWVEATFNSAPFSGYVKADGINAVHENLEMYGTLPIEYGMARTNEGTFVPAYSHLVDIRKYFNVFSSTLELSNLTDFSQYDLVVSMKLSTSETTIGEPFYNTNLCMVQYDLIPMIRKAAELFAKDGYRIVIYDAYRPTSVQQRWFDVVRVHKWVADPSIGMGGVHDRGTALDISLIDTNGNLLEMPTPMHTFTEESARSSPTMTQTARDNMNYMLNVMLQCGFTYINSEWWHFQDIDTKYYLPTDHPIDSIPLAAGEATEIVTVHVP